MKWKTSWAGTKGLSYELNLFSFHRHFKVTFETIDGSYTNHWPRLFSSNYRNPNTPTPLDTTWPQYTADRGEYLGLSPNLTQRSKMRPDKMTLWNEFLPSIEEIVKPITTFPIPTTSHKPTKSGKPDHKKGTATACLFVVVVFIFLADPSFLLLYYLFTCGTVCFCGAMQGLFVCVVCLYSCCCCPLFWHLTFYHFSAINFEND